MIEQKNTGVDLNEAVKRIVEQLHLIPQWVEKAEDAFQIERTFRQKIGEELYKMAGSSGETWSHILLYQDHRCYRILTHADTIR